MGAPITKQTKISSSQRAYYDSYYDPSKNANKKIINNMIKKAHLKFEVSGKQNVQPQKNENKIIKSQNLQKEVIKKKEDPNILSLNSNRSDFDVVPGDDLQTITKFMNNTKNQFLYKESNFFLKTININCNFEQKFFSLPEELIFLVIGFLIDEYYTLVSINSLWYYKINEILDNKFIEIDNLFIQNHLDIFSFQKGYNSFTPLNNKKAQNKQKNFRIDRNLIFELLPVMESNEKIFFLRNTKFYSR